MCIRDRKKCPYSVPQNKSKPNLPRPAKPQGKPPLSKKKSEVTVELSPSTNTHSSNIHPNNEVGVLEELVGEKQFSSFQTRGNEASGECVDEVIEELPAKTEDFKGEYFGISSL
eukprot:TRINITY_DN8814_c0_g1_i2.p2 TRINITY_DN8814_c0_g1~~TRINITY_DN8814_c0_g1_i2.p2  ORF type:complete len:114 (+),score=27.46 TRINITY_DN8814_c0_g1_i2:74-415(+)